MKTFRELKYAIGAMAVVFVFAFALTGCKDETRYYTINYKIVNQIESDIVVELKLGNKDVITIEPGETHLINTLVRRYENGDPVPAMTPEILHAEMRIGEDIVPRDIWKREYWQVDLNNDIYTLIVTAELLETVNSQYDNQNQRTI